jgi:hypothetical protein
LKPTNDLKVDAISYANENSRKNRQTAKYYIENFVHALASPKGGAKKEKVEVAVIM